MQDNVAATFGSSKTPPWNTLEIGFIDDNGSTATNIISATLDQASVGGGTRTALGTVSSAALSGTTTGTFSSSIDFSQYLTHVEANLTRLGATSCSQRTLRVYRSTETTASQAARGPTQDLSAAPPAPPQPR